MIDAQKMAAFAGSAPEDIEEEGAEGEETTPAEGEKFADLLPLLLEYAEDVVDVSDEMDSDILSDPSLEMGPDDQTILQDGVSQLDRRLRSALEKAASAGIEMADAETLADQMVAEGAIDDAERVAGWLYRVGQALGGALPEENEEGEESEEELPAEEPEEGV